MIQDFFFAAWPWIACGLMTAIVIVGGLEKTSDEEVLEMEEDKIATCQSQAFSFYFAAILAYVTAVVILFDPNADHSNSPIWFILGSMYIAFGIWSKKRKK